MIAASLLLLAGNWLAFHDWREAHTVRDWLMLMASLLVFLRVARAFCHATLDPDERVTQPNASGLRPWPSKPVVSQKQEGFDHFKLCVL